MPYYVYKCKTCNKTLEIEQKITEPSLEFCEDYCREPYSESEGPKKGVLKRVLQPIFTIFKGPGFHVNDYKKD